jgi:hypothetical protein
LREASWSAPALWRFWHGGGTDLFTIIVETEEALVLQEMLSLKTSCGHKVVNQPAAPVVKQTLVGALTAATLCNQRKRM